MRKILNDEKRDIGTNQKDFSSLKHWFSVQNFIIYKALLSLSLSLYCTSPLLRFLLTNYGASTEVIICRNNSEKHFRNLIFFVLVLLNVPTTLFLL